MLFAYLYELLMSLVGLRKGSRSRKLFERGTEYIFTELAEKTNKKGYATVKVPLSFLPKWITGNEVKWITVVDDLDFAEFVGTYGTSKNNKDPAYRLPFTIIDDVMGTNSIASVVDENVGRDRRMMKNVIHNFERIDNSINKNVGKWMSTNLEKEVDLEKNIKLILTKILCESIMGIDNLPKGDALDELTSLVHSFDRALMDYDVKKIKQYGKMLKPISKNIYESNPETTQQKDRSVLPHLIRDYDPSPTNIGPTLLATTNVTNLVCFTIIFLASEEKWQNILREALLNDDKKTIDNYYKEMVRLFIPINIPRYASKEVEFNGETFPPNTMFHILGRKIRMDPDIYPEPETFNPDRFNESNISMNSIKLCPFGFGPRVCPASSKATKHVWLRTMEILLKNHKINLSDSTKKMESIDKNVRIIELKNTYWGKLTEL